MEKEKNNASCLFCHKPYVKNGIFEKKNCSRKKFSLKKIIKLKILHEKNWIKTTKIEFFVKNLVKNGIFEKLI